jgi:hypothetical protein
MCLSAFQILVMEGVCWAPIIDLCEYAASVLAVECLFVCDAFVNF